VPRAATAGTATGHPARYRHPATQPMERGAPGAAAHRPSVESAAPARTGGSTDRPKPGPAPFGPGRKENPLSTHPARDYMPPRVPMTSWLCPSGAWASCPHAIHVDSAQEHRAFTT